MQLVMADQKLEQVPHRIFKTAKARAILAQLIYMDFSNNYLMQIPGPEFVFWLSECRKFDLRKNDLRGLPVGSVWPLTPRLSSRFTGRYQCHEAPSNLALARKQGPEAAASHRR